MTRLFNYPIYALYSLIINVSLFQGLVHGEIRCRNAYVVEHSEKLFKETRVVC